MPLIVEEIPDGIRSEVDAALAWLNREEGRSFRVTGIVDPEQALARRGDALDLGLVLCEGDLCLRQDLRVRRANGGFEIVRIADDPARKDDPPPALDPPVGVRRSWLDEKLEKHAFVVLVFYRGFW